MKTRCPKCLTIFRISPEQLVARDGKVRCGHCQAIFNALDTLLDTPASTPASQSNTHAEPSPAETHPARDISEAPRKASETSSANTPEKKKSGKDRESEPPEAGAATDIPETPSENLPARVPEKAPERLPEKAPEKAPEHLPRVEPPFSREPGEISGYPKWTEGVIAPPLVLSSEKPLRWPFPLAAVALALILTGQALFHFRDELARAAPFLRPALESFSLALGAPLRLPRHIDFISIEASDLQSDPARAHVLILNATLRNKAPYGQAYPSLELSLTDVQDVVIARRAFVAADYLPKAASSPVFSGNSDAAVRLWVEALDINASGYRLFVFYP